MTSKLFAGKRSVNHQRNREYEMFTEVNNDVAAQIFYPVVRSRSFRKLYIIIEEARNKVIFFAKHLLLTTDLNWALRFAGRYQF